MSTIVGNLRAVLGLDSTGFQSGLQESQSRFAGFGRQMATIGAGVAAAGVAAFASFNSSASRMTDLQRQADIAGLSAQEFKTAALAVEEHGIQQDKLSDILKDVNDKFGDYAATGGGQLKDFFENIAPQVGLTIEAFEGLNSSDALALYVTALEDANVSQAEMTFYMEALANDATALVPAFRNGGAEISAMAERMDELGIAIDENLIASTREARGDINLISEALRTNFDQAVLQMGPSLANLAAALVPVAGGIATVIEKVIEWTDIAGKGARQFVDSFIAAMSGLPSSASGIIVQLAAGTAAGMSTIATGAVGWAADIVRSIIDGLKGLYQAGVDAVAELARGMRESVTGLIADAATWGSDIAAGLASGIRNRATAVRDSVVGLADNVKGWFTDEVEIQSPSKVFQRFGGWLTEGLANGIDGGAGDVQSSMQGVAGGMLSHFDGVLSGARNLTDVFDNIKASFANTLTDMAQNAMQSGLSGILGSVFGAIDPLAGALRGAGLNAIPAFAVGTNYAPGGLAQINERGGEIVNLPRGTQVIPHDLSKQMMQSRRENVSFHVTASFDQDAQPIIKSVVRREAQRAANQAVQGTGRASADARYLREGKN
ncbi:hypothetical protein CP157_01144 [Paracoccus marcusii]|uniref:hypothetical protein n=1 Tax=Paracoccus marcusii TaxID=59779 RepID=UPI001C3E0512|nr:hypothetical protein [Paracoccus marcusii]QXI63426.1 hypothetical protein CP157_01144 [Paracoccus marcusii]